MLFESGSGPAAHYLIIEPAHLIAVLFDLGLLISLSVLGFACLLRP